MDMYCTSRPIPCGDHLDDMLWLWILTDKVGSQVHSQLLEVWIVSQLLFISCSLWLEELRQNGGYCIHPFNGKFTYSSLSFLAFSLSNTSSCCSFVSFIVCSSWLLTGWTGGVRSAHSEGWSPYFCNWYWCLAESSSKACSETQVM